MVLPLFLYTFAAYAAADQPLLAENQQPSLTIDVAMSCNNVAELRTDNVTAALTDLYRHLGHQSLWQQPQHLCALQTELAKLADDGLEPDNYGFALNAPVPADACAELRISTEYLLALEHLSRGRLSQADYDSVWHASPQPPASAPALADLALTALNNGVSAAFARARPALQEYQDLRAAYAAMDKTPTQRLAVPAGPLLRPGMTDTRVAQIARQLLQDGFLPAGAETNLTSQVYGSALEQAVRHFQTNQGLQSDGIIGPQTIRALNITPAQRLQQVQRNLERLRWINAQRSDYLLLINVAGGHLQLLRGNNRIWQARAQTGRASRPTPTLVSSINRITLNPAWTVPPTIFREDILPQIRRNTDYLASHGMQVLDTQGNVLEPQQINWNNPRGIVLRQPPGQTNPLGQMVFRFPNPFSVYLHDTPSQHLFQQTNRNLSSGCVRVENAAELTTHLLADLPQQQRDAIAAQLLSGQTHEVALRQGPQVILAYWTAYVDNHGRLAFYPDNYGMDLTGTVSQADAGNHLRQLSEVTAAQREAACGYYPEISAAHPPLRRAPYQLRPNV